MRKRIKQIYLLTAVFLCAVLLAACSQKTIDDTAYIGTFLGDSGCDLIIEATENGTYSVQLAIYRLTGLDDGVGELTAEGMAFTATDASGDPIGGIITVEGDTATVTFTASTWPYLENGSSFSYIRTSDHEEVTKDTVTDIVSPNLNLATLKDLAARCGENLTWTDFDPYYSEDIGSGLYIRRYPINMDYCLLVGGGSMELPPMYIRLVSEYDTDNYIDVRTDNIDDFINNTPQTGSFSYEEVLKTYQENDPGVKYSGFRNTSRAAIETINDAIEQAKRECTIEYDALDVSYDSTAYVWQIVFSTAGMLGGDQSVYMDSYGVTCLVVYGE